MRSVIKTTMLLALLAALFSMVGGAIGGQTGMAIAFVLALLMNMGAYWFSADLTLRMTGAREASPTEAPELHRLVEELAIFARVPKPRVAIVDSLSPNAFATGRDTHHAAIAVTRGILEILSRDELAAVLAHELAHVRNRDIMISSVAATIAGAITMLANLAQWSIFFGGLTDADDDEHAGKFVGPIGSLVLILLAPIAATLIHLAISRSREYAADETGAHIHGNPESLARALQQLEVASSVRPLPVNPAAGHLFIVRPFDARRFAGLFSTHPPLSERVRRLRKMQMRVLAASSGALT